MIIISPGALDDVSQSIVRALLSAGDYRGKPFVTGTIDPDILHRTALAALGMASGETIWVLGTPPMEIEPDEKLPFIKKVYPSGSRR